MSYTRLTDFASKDTLLSGNPAKVIRGTEIDAEFAALETADALNAKTGTGVSFSSITDTGNLTFTGTGNRITGDFSNATPTNRVLFQSSTPGGITSLGVIPNPTGTSTALALNAQPDPNNSSRFTLASFAEADAQLNADITGTGTYLPMTFYTGGSERVRIASTGAVAIGHTAPAATLDVAGGAWFRGAPTAGAVLTIFPDNISGANGVTLAASFASGGYGPMRFFTGNAEAMRIDASGNVTVTNATGGLGYGPGAGGTVTQATSRTTPVTINKPTGAITMFSAAGSATPAQFTVQNSLVAATDVVVLSYKSSSNVYQFVVSNVADGSFNISFWTQSGVASDTPVINFAIIKGVIA